MKTFCRVCFIVCAAVSKAAREVVRFARSMKTVLERATVQGQYMVMAVGQFQTHTEPAQERDVFQRLLRGDGGVFGEHATQHKDVEFAKGHVSTTHTREKKAIPEGDIQRHLGLETHV